MKNHIHGNQNKNGLFRRVMAFLLSLVIIFSNFPEELAGVVKVMPQTVRAYVDDAEITHTFEINTLRALYEYSQNLKTNPSDYNNAVLIIADSVTCELEENHEFAKLDENGEQILDEGGNPVFEHISFVPFGTAGTPFNGKIIINQTTGGFYPIESTLPVFDTVYDSVEIVDSNGSVKKVSINRSENADEPLFARKVIHDSRETSSPANWDIVAGNLGETGYSSSGLIGTIGANASNDGTVVNVTYAYNSTASINSAGSAGLICGKINQGATVNVTLSGTNNTFGVTSSGAKAGALAGEMYAGSNIVLTVAGSPAYDLSVARTISGSSYAGGLVGYAEGAEVSIREASVDGEGNITYSSVPFVALGTITASDAAGGIYGCYKATSAVNWSGMYSVGSTSSYCNVGAKYVGGYVGDLIGNGNDVTFAGTVADVENNVTASDLQVYVSQCGSAENYGGLVGRYTASALANSFNVIQTSVHARVSGSFTGTSYYGGAIGNIYGNAAAYVKFDNFTANAEAGSGTSSFFGGAVGNAGDAGSMLDIGSITVTTSEEYKGGGVVGRLNKGVLRLSGITDLSDADSASAGKVQGQIVGYRTDALVYALGDGSTAEESASYGNGWRLVRSDTDTEADDIGTWGEVVRISDIEGTASSSNAALTYDGAAHTVTLKPAVIDMTTPLDFAKTALNIQLNNGSDIGALQFAKNGNAVDAANKRATLLASTSLTVSGTISLVGTGITGLMRDGAASNEGNEIGSFTGTITGSSSAEIDLAIGERYGIYTESEETPSVGRGAIFAHKFNGLFAKTSTGAQVYTLVIDGEINVNPIDLGDKINTYVGGLVAFSGGGITIKGVDVKEDVNCTYLGGYGPLVGGMIGAIGSECATAITISKADDAAAGTKTIVSPQVTIKGALPSNGNEEYKHAFGGLIGVDCSKNAHSISISDISLSVKIDASDSGTETVSVSTAGLISDLAYIGNGNNSDMRTLSLTDIEISRTMLSNNATGNTGGILGFRWYNTNVTMDDVELKSVKIGETTYHNTLSTTASHVAGLVYRATGHWVINSKDLKVNSLVISNTPSDSLGVLIHDGHYNSSGIFLELTAHDSYILAGNNALTIPSMSEKVYDELCAYSATKAETILNNGTNGVISYHTSGVFSMDESNCNSYQNVYNTTVVNPNSRYYYNVDGTNRTAPDNGWKLLVWSLNRYAAANIKQHFTDPFNGGAVTGNFDLKGISYYPINVGSEVTLGDMTIKFYNKEIETTENKGTTKKTTRSNTSQQYLMHSGLFKNVTSTLTTTGNIHFRGSIAKDDTYTGALINGTLDGGRLTTAEDKEIVLEGVKLYKTSGIANDGYLLINKITSRTADGVTYGPRMVLCGVRVGEEDNDEDDSNDEELYTSSDATSGIAKSLIGDVIGTSVDLTFKKIRLDSRTSSSADGNNYGTSRSIFTHATLLNKFDVDSNSNGVYNYTFDEDWTNGHWVTYGKEITSSAQYVSNGVSNEKWYSGSPRYFTRPDRAPTSGTTASEEFNFSEDDKYLPYVYLWNGTTGATNEYKELRVNVQTNGIIDGCGTYNHPYDITTADQFVTVCRLLNNAANFTSNMSLRLPVTVGSDEYWCTVDDSEHIDCALYTYNETEFTSTTEGANPWTISQVREYLAGAYYQISGEGFTIEDNQFVGLGFIDSNDANKENYVFHGIITGKTGNEVITNKTSYPLIRVSNGCVVRNITINVNTSVEVIVKGHATTTPFAYTHDKQYLYYGGVIGEIMGGDNIIDNVKVNYTNNNGLSLKINDNNGYLSTVGGYVGVVVNGALIFRNMTASHFNSGNISNFIVGSDGTNNSKKNYQLSTNTAHLYINPYIGRVINGYAVNETTDRYSGDLTENQYTLINNTKNYEISDIKTSGFSPLSIDTFKAGDGTTLDRINVPDGQALFILSLITQSGAGTATTAGGEYAYAIGYDGTTKYDTESAVMNAATHLAAYNEIGKETTTDYNIMKNNDTWGSKTAVPYVIYKYTAADTTTTPNTYPARTVTGKTYFIKLSNTTKNYVYNLPVSFRGIGSICNFNTQDAGNNIKPRYCMSIYGMEGNGDTVVNVNLDYKVYTNTYDNYINTVYHDKYNNLVNNKATDYSYVSVGFGLFNNLRQLYKTSNESYNLTNGYFIGNFSVSGNIKVTEYNTSGGELTGGGLRNTANNGKDYGKRHPVGGLIGGVGCYGYINLFKLNLTGLTISGKSAGAVGGYIGTANVTENDTRSGIGMSYFFVNACNAYRTKITATNAGCGGVLGVTYSGYSCIYVNTALASESDKTSFAGSDNYYKSSMELSMSNNTDINRLECGTGGILGAMRNGYNVKLWINNVTITGYAATTSADAKIENNSETTSIQSLTSGVGGLIGYVRKAASVNITNCTIKNINIKGPYAGGLFGNIAYDDNTSYQDYGRPPKISINNCKVYADAVDADGNKLNYTIEGVHFAGGITGQFITSASYSQGAGTGKTYGTDNIGYDGITNFMYDIDGCEIYGYTIAQSGSVANTGVGGIMGNADYATRSVVNTSVHDCTIKAKNIATHGMGGVVGYTSRDIYGYNISLYNNRFADYDGGNSTSAKYGNFLGNNNGGKVIKIAGFSRSGNVFDDGTTDGAGITVETGSNNNGSGSYIVCSDYVGVGTGNSHGTAMGSLIGSGVSNVEQGVAKDFFPYATVSAKIKTGSTAFLTGDGVSMYARQTRRKAVDVNGDYVMDGENYTYVSDGNGGYIYDSSEAPMVMAIYDDRNNVTDIPSLKNSQIYSSVPTVDLTTVYNMFNADSNAEAYITTLKDEIGLPSSYEGSNFPLLVIGGRTSGDYTDEITAYIRMLTNTADSYTTNVTGKYEIDILQCKFGSGNYYVYATNPSLGGLRRNNSGHYIMYDNYADTVQSGKQFTLIDVKFYNPADSDTTSYEVAYHVYVPVLTKKMISFQFHSASMQGTDYVGSKYTFGNKTAGNFDSWMTVYVKFTYPAGQIQQILNTGKGLNWNSSKIVELDYGSQQDLANSTQFVLLDNNNGVDKEYYLTKAGISTDLTSGLAKDVIELASFETKRDKDAVLSETVAFKPQNLSEFTKTNVIYSANGSNTGNYAETTLDAADYVAYAYDEYGENIKYFKQALGAGTYDLTYIGSDVIETYYISMYAYGDDNVFSSTENTNDAYGLKITCPLTLEGNVMCKRSNYLNENANSSVYMGKIFQQTIKMSGLNQTTEIAVGNNAITATLESEISFIPGDNARYFQNSMATNNITLFQGFVLRLNRHNEQGIITNDSKIYTAPTFTYSIATNSGIPGQSSAGLEAPLEENAPYVFVPPIEIAIPSTTSNSSWIAKQTVTVTLTFEDEIETLGEEFPTRIGTSSNNKAGIGLSASANIEYSGDRVEYSNQILQSAEDTRRYHIQKTQSANLTLTALDQTISDGYDQYGEQSHNRSSLGINAKYLDTGLLYKTGDNFEHIDVAVNFDVSQLPENIYNGSYSLYFDIKLEQKQNNNAASGYVYSQVDMNSFLHEFGYYSKGAVLYGTNSDGTYHYKIPISSDQSQWLMEYASGQFLGTLSFDVYTAAALESIEGYLYSNYRITMSAKVALTSDEATGYEGDSDYVVYTNAKINAAFVTGN